MGCLYFLDNLRFPVMDTLMRIVARLGEETAFLVAGLVRPMSIRRLSNTVFQENSFVLLKTQRLLRYGFCDFEKNHRISSHYDLYIKKFNSYESNFLIECQY